ncbi:MAG: S9 family peptidase [Gemmatimonadaceae bacterium]|nr:S9 family peptidase [Chitinophagaceae bacterium]
MRILLLALICSTNIALSQNTLQKLTVEKIMRDPKWIGSSPSSLNWSNDGKTLFFSWNPDQSMSDSIYFITKENSTPQKSTYEQRQSTVMQNNVEYNTANTAYTFSKDGDIWMADAKTAKQRRITQTFEFESSPKFSFNDTKIVFTRSQNLYAWDIATGLTTQLTNFQRGMAAPRIRRDTSTVQEKWLREDQLRNFEVLRSRKQKKDANDSMINALPKRKELRTIYTEDKNLFGLTISPDGRFITGRLLRNLPGKNTIIPSFVTESGFTEDIFGRTKVGTVQGTQEMFLFDTIEDTVYNIRVDSIPGIRDIPAYVKDYPKVWEEKNKKPVNRGVNFLSASWSPKGNYAIVDLRSHDYKDRWLMILDPKTGKLSLADRQHDDAWIGGPGIGGGFGGGNTGWIDDNSFWFQSEATGYSQLYTFNASTKEKKAITSGNYEVQQTILSKDKKYFYLSSNEVHPGEQQFYRLPVTGGKAERLTSMTGAAQVSLSPDEKSIAYLYSYSNKPWELFVQENKPGAKAIQITNKAASAEFSSYAWRDPELTTITARDGVPVYARLYKPANPHPSKPAVIFVHGAGYLQNAHKWWSSYFREYMFHNLLADAGYTVLDIDYRGSAGYGRDWRTGIYRFMGGKDLSDHLDAAKWLTEKQGVDPKRIGIYGGSYGGFITLMALFTSPGTFKAGAALRPVTDWAQYNHGYTANILNEPATDSIAYRKSSPFYYAAGLQDHLLICHGMVDVNVHYQDAVKLAQRLIELGKDNWELAGYPMEDHGFVEPSSWTDEYKRILKLFETNLK